MQDLKTIREKINELGTKMRALMTTAGEAKRELTPEEEVEFERMDTEREPLIAKEKRLVRMEELEGTRGRQTDREEPRQGPRPGRSSETTRTDPEQERRDHSEVLRGFFLPAEYRNAEYAAACKRLGVPEHQGNRSFQVLAPEKLRSKDPADIARWEARNRRQLYRVDPSQGRWSVRGTPQPEGGLTVGIFSPDNTGHYAVQPSYMLQSLEEALLAFGGMRESSTTVRTDSGIPLPFPTMNDTSNEAVIISETTQETNELEPTFGRMTLNSFTWSTKKVPMSIEFLQDNGVNAEARIGEILGTRIARGTNRKFTVGSGSGEPTGIFTAATSSGVTTASATAITYQELMNLEHSVDPAYRLRGPNGSKWMMGDDTLLAIKKIMVPHFSGDTAGWPLWRPGLTVGEPDTIDGYQYVINQHSPTFAATHTPILFGALWKYQIRDVRMLEILRLTELRAEFREVLWLGFYRGDGNLLDAGTHPVKYLTMHS